MPSHFQQDCHDMGLDYLLLCFVRNTRPSTSLGFRYTSPFKDSLIPTIGSLHSGQI